MKGVQRVASDRDIPKLDPLEKHFRIASYHGGGSLFLRYLSPTSGRSDSLKVVLYVHGATFSSALSIAHRFDGRSWRDELCASGFHVWGFDFHGYGYSDPYPAMSEPADRNSALGCVDDGSRQIERAVRFITEYHNVSSISIVAHSWGTIATGHFAGRHPGLVKRLVFFGPIACRAKTKEIPAFPAWRCVSLKDQWNRFTADIPVGEPAVLSRRHFDEWGERYLDTDPESRTRMPASVKTPTGPWYDIAAAWAGKLSYDPALVRAPVAIIRGEWDSLCADVDARWLFESFKASPIKRDIKISRGTHLMHLEESRYALYRETQNFLDGGDCPPQSLL